jgi:hypothetical protein
MPLIIPYPVNRAERAFYQIISAIAEMMFTCFMPIENLS